MNPILSVHIPKTAGTSLLHTYAQMFGPSRVLLDYEHHTYPAIKRLGVLKPENKPFNFLKAAARAVHLDSLARPVLRALRVNAAKAFQVDSRLSGIDIVHGHFQISDYLDRFPDSPRVVVLRDPLERIWSNYLHWSRLPEGVPLNPWFERGMSFREFALFEQAANPMSLQLSPLSIDDFEVVGVTQRLDLFLASFREFAGSYFDRSFTSSHFRVNVTESSSLPDLDSAFQRSFERLHSRDVGLYRRALEIVLS